MECKECRRELNCGRLRGRLQSTGGFPGVGPPRLGDGVGGLPTALLAGTFMRVCCLWTSPSVLGSPLCSLVLFLISRQIYIVFKM